MKKHRKKGEIGKDVGRAIVAVIVSFLAAFPIYWMISTSIKPKLEWVAIPIVWLTENPTHLNYWAIFARPEELPGFYQMGEPATGPILNSLIIASGATAIALFVGMFAAYGISRYRAAGQGSFFFFLMFRMFPPIAIIIPLLISYSTLKLTDTHIGMMLVYAAVTVPFVIWLMKSFFDEVPKEIDEAAILDGCSLFGALFRGVLPLVKAGLAVTGLFIFILDWSDFFIALILTRSAAITIPVQIAQMTTATGYMYGPMSALGTIALIPVLIFGILIQKHLVRGFTFGAIKGR